MKKLFRITSKDKKYPRGITEKILKACWGDSEFAVDVYQDMVGKLFYWYHYGKETYFVPLVSSKTELYYKPIDLYTKQINFVDCGGCNKSIDTFRKQIAETMPVDEQLYAVLYSGEWCFENVKGEKANFLICNAEVFDKKELKEGEELPMLHELAVRVVVLLSARKSAEDVGANKKIGKIFCSPGKMFL